MGLGTLPGVDGTLPGVNGIPFLLDGTYLWGVLQVIRVVYAGHRATLFVLFSKSVLG